LSAVVSLDLGHEPAEAKAAARSGSLGANRQATGIGDQISSHSCRRWLLKHNRNIKVRAAFTIETKLLDR
jgi:hypothetical protein